MRHTLLPVILLAALLPVTASGSAEEESAPVLTLVPGSPALNTDRIQPFAVEFRYRRATNPDPGSGTRVTWKLERLEATTDRDRPLWRTTLTTHGDGVQYLDINEFDAQTLAHHRASVPTQLQNGEIADIELSINHSGVTGAVTGRDSGTRNSIAFPLEQAVMGGGWDLLPALVDLKPGMTLRFPALDFPNQSWSWQEGRVMGVEEIDTPLGPQQTWRIDTLQGHRYWVNQAPPYVYRRLFVLSEGVSLLWELSGS